MKINLEGNKLTIEFPPTATADLEVNGALQARYSIGKSEGPEDLRDYIKRANAATGVFRNLDELRKKLGNKEFLEGFLAGLNGKYSRTDHGDVIPPATGGINFNYIRGWEVGTYFYAVEGIVRTGQDPRSSW